MEHFYYAMSKNKIINNGFFLYERKWVDFIHFNAISPFRSYE